MMGIAPAWAWMSDAPRQRTGVRALQIVIGLFLLLRISGEAQWTPLLWGPWGWPFESAVSRVHGQVFRSDDVVYGGLAVLAAAAVLLVLGVRTRIAAVAAMLVYWPLARRMPEIVDGGDNLVRVLLFFMILVLPPSEQPRARSLRGWFHNLAIVVIATQIIFVYFSAALIKMTGTPWTHGTATYLLAQNEVFSRPGMLAFFSIPFVATTTTFGVLFLQMFFPFALASRVRRPWLVLMVLFHLWTIVAMGLMTFGLAMIGAILFLLTNDEYRVIGARLAPVRARCVDLLRGLGLGLGRGRAGDDEACL